MTETFWPQFFEFGREDFPTSEDIDITIVSVSEQESRNEKRKADVYALLPQFLADPEVTTVGKLILKREALALANYSLDDISAITYNADEQSALLDVELLNEDEEPVEPKAGQDHLLFLSIYRSANDTAAKFNAIAVRHTLRLKEVEEAKINAAGAVEGGGWALENMASAAWAKRMNNIVQEEANNVPSNLG